MYMKKLVVKCKNNKIKISKYILNIFQNLHYSEFCKALRNKDIKINSKRINKDIDVSNNDTIEIYLSDKILYNLPKSINYIYEDENILVAYKPQGILSNNEYKDTINIEPTFEDLIKKDKNDVENNIHICHRLDRNTEGLILFSKNSNSYSELLKAFKLGYIEKEYIAYVANSKFNKQSDTISSYLLKDSQNGISKIYEENIKGSKNIITEYIVIKNYPKQDFAKLNIKIHCGKTHQIRAQFAYMHHPIIGDSKYGKNDINKKFGIYKQLLFAYKYIFGLPKEYNLSYLNNIVLETKIPDYENSLLKGGQNE